MNSKLNLKLVKIKRAQPDGDEKKSRRREIKKSKAKGMNTKNLSHFYAFTNWKHSSSGRQILKAPKKSALSSFVAFK